MANELKDALDQIKIYVGEISDVQRAILGQAVTAIPEARANEPVAYIYLRDGRQEHGINRVQGIHVLELRFYWLLIPANSELVEQSVASYVDLISAKFYSDLNLNDKCTVALLTGASGNREYTTGYELVSDKLHRILTFPLVVRQWTHTMTG